MSTQPDMVDELCDLLRELNVKPYINTFYLGHEQRVKAFRIRSRAFLTGRRAAVRHVEFKSARKDGTG